MQELLNSLNQFDSENVILHLLTRNENTREYGVLTTEPNRAIREDLIHMVMEHLADYLSRDYEEEEYSPITKHDSNVYETIAVNQISTFEEIHDLMHGDLPFYNSRNLDDDIKIWAFIIVIGEIDNDEIIVFQRCEPKKQLKPGKFLMLFEREDGYFSKFDETILTVDPRMDCISYNEKMYIFRKYYFEQIFGLISGDEIEQKIGELSQENILVDLVEFVELCSHDRNKEKKLFKVLEESGFNLLTKENIEKLNNSHNLGIKIGNGRIELTPTIVKNLLNLMNKDCVDDSISDEPFISHSKSPVRKN